jgi:MFS family permease
MTSELKIGAGARNSLRASFLIMGIASMAWVPRIPEIKDAVGLSNGQFGFVFLGSTIGSVLGSQFAGRAIHTFGSRPVIHISSVLLPLGLVAMAYATTATQLFFALMLMGFGYALTDMGLNSQGIVVEKILDQKCLSSFHAMWSVGSFLSAVFGGFMIAHLTPKENLLLIAILSALSFFPANRYLLNPTMDQHAGNTGEITAAKIPFLGKSSLPLWALGVGMIAGMVAEGAASDWAGILLRENMQISSRLYATAFASFALAMIVSRFMGDKVLHKYGARNTVRYGGVVGGAVWGLSIAIAVPLSSYAQIPAVIIVNIGFIFAGLGIGPMFPAFILAASRIKGVAPAVAISRVGLIGISGYFIGPTITGLFAEVTSLSIAMTYPVLMMVLGGYMSRAIKEEEREKNLESPALNKSK